MHILAYVLGETVKTGFTTSVLSLSIYSFHTNIGTSWFSMLGKNLFPNKETIKTQCHEQNGPNRDKHNRYT